MHRIRSWLLIIYVSLFTLLISHPTFASMGSTGGGGGGGTGGGSYGSSGGDGGNIFAPGADSLFWNINLALLFVTVILLFILLPFPSSNDSRPNSDAPTAWVDTNKQWYLQPNFTIYDFELMYDKLSPCELPVDSDILVRLYGRAQYAYGDAIRRLITGQTHYLSDLKPLLGPVFLNTMDTEIRMKASRGIFDDTVFSHGEVVGCRRINSHEIAVKIKVLGVDREVNISKLEPSFERSSWADYVIFGYHDGQWTIDNLVYGEHFHLNGIDFNHQKSLLKGGTYFEQQLPEIDEHLRTCARNYQRASGNDSAKFVMTCFLIGVIPALLAIILSSLFPHRAQAEVICGIIVVINVILGWILYRIIKKG